MIYEGSPLFYIYDMIDKKMHSEALEAIEEKLRDDPSSPDLFNLRGQCFYELGRYREALESFDSSLKLYDRDFFPYEMKGKCLFYTESYIESIDAFDAAVQRTNNQNKKVDLLLSAGFGALIANDMRAFQYFPKAFDLNSKLTVDAIQEIFEKLFLDPIMQLTIEEKIKLQEMINELREEIEEAKAKIVKWGITKTDSAPPASAGGASSPPPPRAPPPSPPSIPPRQY